MLEEGKEGASVRGSGGGSTPELEEALGSVAGASTFLVSLRDSIASEFSTGVAEEMCALAEVTCALAEVAETP